MDFRFSILDFRFKKISTKILFPINRDKIVNLKSKIKIIIILMACLGLGGRMVTGEESQRYMCPPDMAWVKAGGFCMDRYEFPNHAGVEPVSDIDFEEAEAICASRGKRVPTVAEFRAACGGETGTLYPYGPEYVPNRCRTGLNWADGPAPAGSYPECVGYGIYDLTGNVWEWVKGPGDWQYIAGGAWNIGPNHANCRDIVQFIGLIVAPSVGVRCALTPVRP